MSKEEIKKIFTNYKTVAVVGLSRDPEKESYSVANYLQKHCFRIIPINPFADVVLGEKSYRSLLDLPPALQQTLEIIDVFRKAEDVPPVVDQVLELKKRFGNPYVLWLQLGIVNDQAADSAKRAGLTVIMDKCMMQEHKRLCK